MTTFSGQVHFTGENGTSFTYKCADPSQFEHLVRLTKLYKQPCNNNYVGIKNLIMPIRTDSAKNFAKDLFLPNVVAVATNVKNVIAKIFLMLLALVFDSATLVIRLGMAIPRCISNKMVAPHAIHDFLKTQGTAAQAVLKGEQVIMTFQSNFNTFDTSNSLNPTFNPLYKRTTGCIEDEPHSFVEEITDQAQISTSGCVEIKTRAVFKRAVAFKELATPGQLSEFLNAKLTEKDLLPA